MDEKVEKTPDKTDAEIKLAFLEAYKKLVREYGCDFMPQPPQIVRVSFFNPDEQTETKTDTKTDTKE